MCYIAAMNITQELLPTPWLWLSWAAYLTLLLAAIRQARWERLKDGELIHVYLGSCVALMVMWTVKAGIDPGLSFHYLGATLFTLMFGWELAFIGLSLALLGTTIGLGGEWGAFCVNVLAKGALPVVFSHWLLRLVQDRLPPNVFVYIFINAFFGAALALLLGHFAVAGVLGAAGAYTGAYLVSEYLVFTPLMMFSEAWITGMLVAIFVGYRPNWLTTFEDSKYLHGK